ncbi:MAG: ABC transporter permease [Oscillospiraceae bacterium]|nr:ABC transporter permease [Oscillospiraceae bacterium]
MGSVYKKEMKVMFSGMMGFIFVAVMLVVVGIFARVYNFGGAYSISNFEYSLNGGIWAYLVIVPVLTMRSMAEETRSKTDQLLFTSPISMSEIIMGKFFAMITIIGIPCLVFCTYPIILSAYGTVNFLSAYAGILIFFLLGAMLTSVGLFISTLTDSQIIAAVISFVVVLMALLMSSIIDLVESSSIASVAVFTIVVALATLLVKVMTKDWTIALIVGIVLEVGVMALFFIDSTILETALAAVLSNMAVMGMLDTILFDGLIDLTVYFYFISVTFMFLFLSVQSLEKRRWS